MSIPVYSPQNLSISQASGNIAITWTGVLGATSYAIQRSTDGVNFSALGTSTIPQYVDTLPGTGIMFFYQVAGVNVSGTGPYSATAQMVAAPATEMSLYEIRLRAQQRADRVNSNFVKQDEWNSYINLAQDELYDLLIDTFDDLYSDQYVFINTNGSTQNYPLPDGVSNYIGGSYPNTSGSPAQALHKLVGVDLGINTSNNAWVTLLKYDFIERNRYVYPNSTSTIYGVYNMRYRLMGTNINIIPTPAGNQQLRLWYAPKLKGLLIDSDLSTTSISGWIDYVIVRAAKYALDKEEGTDTSKLDQEIAFLKTRIEQAAASRDVGVPDTISETRQSGGYGGTGWGFGGGQAGF